MTLVLQADSEKFLKKKVQAVLDSLQSSSNEWKYVCNQTVEDAVKLAYVDSYGTYTTTIVFMQVPIMKNNYHGILSTYEQEARKQRAV